jgi:hypothetical protein
LNYARSFFNMHPNLVFNEDQLVNKNFEWEKLLQIESKYTTSKNNIRASIKCLDTSNQSTKLQIQLGAGNKSTYKILFGISSYGGHQTERSDLNIDLGLSSAKAFRSLDEFIINSIIEKKDEFFDDDRSDDLIRRNYYGCVKQDKEQRYNPFLKCKITLSENPEEMENLNTKVFEWVPEGCNSIEGVTTNESKLIRVHANAQVRNLVQPKSQCMCIVQVQSLWFKGDNWGVSIEARLLGIFTKPTELEFFMNEPVAESEPVQVDDNLTFSCMDSEQMQVLDQHVSVNM